MFPQNLPRRSDCISLLLLPRKETQVLKHLLVFLLVTLCASLSSCYPFSLSSSSQKERKRLSFVLQLVETTVAFEREMRDRKARRKARTLLVAQSRSRRRIECAEINDAHLFFSLYLLCTCRDRDLSFTCFFLGKMEPIGGTFKSLDRRIKITHFIKRKEDSIYTHK